jgi:hypothetical protein
MRITMFAAQGRVKPDTENIKDLNLTAVKLKIGMICFANLK